MLTSVSATERIKLWDHFSGPIDQDSVKLEFFRKIHRKNPPFRTKVKLPPRDRVKVPDMVKYHYKKPVNLLPSLKDVLRVEYVTNRYRSIKSDCTEVVEIKLEEECDSKEQTEDESGQMNGDDGDVEQLTTNGDHFHEVNKNVVVNGVMENDECKIEVDGIKNEIQHNDVSNSQENNHVKSEGLNGAYYSQDLIKKENNFLADFMGGVTCEGKRSLFTYFSRFSVQNLLVSAFLTCSDLSKYRFLFYDKTEICIELTLILAYYDCNYTSVKRHVDTNFKLKSKSLTELLKTENCSRTRTYEYFKQLKIFTKNQLFIRKPTSKKRRTNLRNSTITRKPNHYFIQ